MGSNMNRPSTTPAGSQVNTIALAFTLVAGTAVFLRIFTRLVLTRGAGCEDASICIAMAASIALKVTISEEVMHGLGQHNRQLGNDEREVFFKAFWASICVYNLTLTLTKVSLLAQYLKIFPIKWFRKACLGVLGLVSIYGAWTFFSSIFLCTPVAFAWNSAIKNGHCLSRAAVWFTNAGMNIFQDIIILLLPMPVIRTLKIPTGQKTGLVIMLALSASVTIVSIIRLTALNSIVDAKDIPRYNVAHATLSTIEANLGIFCACLPALRPLFAVMAPMYFSSSAVYRNITDIEQHKNLRTFSSISIKTRTNSFRTGTSTQLTKATIYRTPSGTFVMPNSGPYSSEQGSISHSYKQSADHLHKDSTLSLDTLVGRPPLVRFQDRINPLGMSPVTPTNTPLPSTSTRSRRLSSVSTAVSRPRTSDPNAPCIALQTMNSAKPLPITPMPGT